jgi:hypothetical protein
MCCAVLCFKCPFDSHARQIDSSTRVYAKLWQSDLISWACIMQVTLLSLAFDLVFYVNLLQAMVCFSGAVC